MTLLRTPEYSEDEYLVDVEEVTRDSDGALDTFTESDGVSPLLKWALASETILSDLARDLCEAAIVFAEHIGYLRNSKCFSFPEDKRFAYVRM